MKRQNILFVFLIDFSLLNRCGYDPSTSLKRKDRLGYQLGYKNGWDDAVKGVGRSKMLWMTFFFIFILSFMTITASLV